MAGAFPLQLKFSLKELEKKLPLNFGTGNQSTVIVESILNDAVLYISMSGLAKSRTHGMNKLKL